MSKVKYAKALNYLTCFSTGFAILVLELVAFRLLAPYYGVSNIVTGTIINAILLALAAGYMFGGYFADKYKSDQLPYFIIFFAAVYLIVIYVFYKPLIHALADLSVMFGSALTTIIMFFIPAVLLAFIPPYFIRAISLDTTVGKTTGIIYAISTLGSIVGGILTTFLFIPYLGSLNTFLIAVLVLSGVAILGLIRFHRRAVFLMVMVLPLFFPCSPESGKFVYSGESEYNVITIKKDARGEALYLLLNDGKGHHSKTLDPDTMMSNDYYDDFLVAQLLSNAKHTLILGNAAGTSMRQAGYFFNNHVDGVEIDPELSLLGRTYFGLRLNDKLKIYHEDARIFMNRNRQKYDTIIVDVYAGSPYVPFHVATLEFYEQVRNSLTADGIVAVNIPFYSLNTELSEYFLNTIERIFPGRTYISGCVAFAFRTKINMQLLAARIDAKSAPPILKELSYTVVSDFKKVKNTNKVFTDNLAPIENLTRDILEKGFPDYAGYHH